MAAVLAASSLCARSLCSGRSKSLAWREAAHMCHKDGSSLPCRAER